VIGGTLQVLEVVNNGPTGRSCWCAGRPLVQTVGSRITDFTARGNRLSVANLQYA
jgi:hypothetical protein